MSLNMKVDFFLVHILWLPCPWSLAAIYWGPQLWGPWAWGRSPQRPPSCAQGRSPSSCPSAPDSRRSCWLSPRKNISQRRKFMNINFTFSLGHWKHEEILILSKLLNSIQTWIGVTSHPSECVKCKIVILYLYLAQLIVDIKCQYSGIVLSVRV